MNKAVFLDRDGVINELVYHREAGVIDSPFTIQQCKLMPEAGKAISLLNRLGYKVIVISNQPGIAKDHFTIVTLQQMHEKIMNELKSDGAYLDKIYFCPHHPEGTNPKYRSVCRCRKPEPGMLEEAARDFNLDIIKCFMVGDNLTDIETGKRVNCRTILIGKMKCELCNLMDEEGIRPDSIAANLMDAARIISGELKTTMLGNTKTTRVTIDS